MDKVELTKFEREYSYLRYGGSATEFMLDNPEAVKQIKEEAKMVLELAEKEVKQQNQKYNIPQELIGAYQEFMKFGGDNTRAVINAINALNSTEELISKDFEKAAQKAYPEDIHKQSIFIHGATYAYTHSKNTQLLDEGLEEAATKYAQDKYMAVQTFQAFKAGANWQKKQDQETIELAEDHAMLAGIIKGTEHTIGNVRSILNKVAYENNGLDVNGDYCEQPYVELDDEFKELLKED